MSIFRVREPFSCSVGGVERVYCAGDLLSSTDPVATPKRVAMFLEPVEEAALRTATVEQATAAPGERRSITTRKAKP
jgi:hypothetical protein